MDPREYHISPNSVLTRRRKALDVLKSQGMTDEEINKTCKAIQEAGLGLNVVNEGINEQSG